MLQLLKESVSSRHAERLEQIVIILIAIEIGELLLPLVGSLRLPILAAWKILMWSHLNTVLGIVTILVDLMA
jgi:hypothetical protein